MPRGRSHGNVLLADGELYTGTVSNFQGNDPAISRSQSLRPTKTESSLNWLQGEVPPPPSPQGAGPGAPGRGCSPQQGLRTEFRLSGPPGLTLGSPPAPTDPAFVASAYIPESLGSLDGDDDKIYFFFSETGQEFEFFENTIVSRIARICKVSTEGSGKQYGCRFRKCQETPLL